MDKLGQYGTFDSLTARRSSMLFTAGFRSSLFISALIRHRQDSISDLGTKFLSIPFDSLSRRSSSLFTSGVSGIFCVWDALLAGLRRVALGWLHIFYFNGWR